MADPTTPDLFGQEPLPAYRHDSATSRAAAEAIAPKAGTLLAKVLDCFWQHGPLTDDQVSEITGIALNSERPRRDDLVKKGLVVSAGVGTNLNGNKAILWARAGDPRIPHPDGPDESGELLRKVHERRPTWLGDRQLRRLIADALTACDGDQRAALRRVLRDVEQLR